MIVEFYTGTSSPQSVVVKNGSNAAITGSPYTSTLVANGRHQITIDNANVTEGEVYYLLVSGLSDYIFKADESGARVFARDWIDPPVDLTETNEKLDQLLESIYPGDDGGGTTVRTLVVKDNNGDPIPAADVWLTDDAAGSIKRADSRLTNAAGKVNFMLNPGTYYLWASKEGWAITNPTTVVIPSG